MKRNGTGAPLVAALVVRRAPRLPGDAGPRGHLRAGQVTLPCALGRGGVTHDKREGDGATPSAAMRIRHGYFRPDRMSRPFCRIPLGALAAGLGWCDDPGAPLYNRPGPAGMAASHENMWRRDGLYDVVFVLDWNLSPRRAGRGSAIFLHCARQDDTKQDDTGSGLRPTLGCVALRAADMRRLLPRLSRNARVEMR